MVKSVFDTGGLIGAERTYSVPAGEAAFTSPGTFNWTALEGVTSVSVVCVGAGGGGAGLITADAGSGGGGGALSWKNNIAVVPGQNYAVTVGLRGLGGSSTPTAGGQSFFSSNTIVSANGGAAGVIGTASGGAGGTRITGAFDGGGNGGQGGNSNINDATDSTPEAGGGGGAGGYSGNGGRGAGAQAASTTGGTGAGGGGGGGGSPDSGTPGGGGGVGIYGEGSNGAGGTGSVGGDGGSGGANGSGATISSSGGHYGGGGGGTDGGTGGGNGANGAVRIIWGTNRSFPSTSVTENSGNRLYSSGVFNLNSVYDSFSNPNGLTYTYYTQGSVTYPTTEAGLDALFNTATVSPTVTFGGTGIHLGVISWGTGGAGGGGIPGTKPSYLPADQFSWMAEGYILAPETGTYFFGVDGDDACDIHVSGVNVANSYGQHPLAGGWSGRVTGANTQVSGSISLTAGQYYTFRARMQDGTGGDALQVGWRKPSDGAIALIPSYFFYRSIG